jgi:hypothetical protein
MGLLQKGLRFRNWIVFGVLSTCEWVAPVKVREDGTAETEKDLLDRLKYAQSETTGIKLGFSKGEVAEMDAQIDAVWQESVEEEVNRRLAARGLTGEVQQADLGQQQQRNGRNGHTKAASHIRT